MVDSIIPPYQYFHDNAGAALSGGYIYIGQEGQNPEAYPKQAYWDAAMTIPATQPIRTVAGRPARNGSPDNVYVSGAYSITVRDSNSGLVASELSVGLKIDSVIASSSDYAPAPFDTVADLLASTDAARGEGEIWEAEGFRYEEADAAASDQHLTTAGGVKLYVLPVVAGDYSAKSFNIKGDNSTDDAAAIQSAYDGIKARGGGRLMFGVGTFIVGSTIDFESPSDDIFNQGIQIVGAGIGRTIFDNQVSSGPMFNVTAGGSAGSNFMMGVVFDSFKIISTAGTSQVGIYLKTAYQVSFDQVHIDGLSGTGVQIPCIVGDNDGSNMVSFRHCRIENCSDWGIDAKGDAGFNETSFIIMDHTFIQACGTASASATPPSGGMRWKGQMLTTRQSAFVLNQNVGLFIPGEAGLAQSCFLYDTTFENNVKRALYCTGIKSLKGRNVQFYNNDDYVITNAAEFDGTSFTIDEVRLKGVIIRATSGNSPYTAFKVTGPNVQLGRCSVEEVIYDNFGYAGQTKQEGYKNDPVAVVQKTGAQSISGAMSAIIFDSEVTDLQGVYDDATGKWRASFITYAQFTGQITVNGLSAGNTVVIELYDDFNAAVLASKTVAANGLTDETFTFDFVAPVGAAGTTRDYQIRATQNSGSSKSLNVSSALNNTLHVRRVSYGDI